MKKLFFVVVVISVFGFSVNRMTSEKATATVNQAQGMYLFVECKPTSEYEYLGTVKNSGAGGFANGQYEPTRDRLIKDVKKKYPQADGIIFLFNNGGSDKADAIKLK